MIAILSALASSAFISYESTAVGLIHRFDNESLANMKYYPGYFALLITTDEYTEKSDYAINVFSSIAAEFTPDCVFGLIYVSDVIDSLNYTFDEIPSIAILQEGTIITSFPFIEEENVLVEQMKAIIYNPDYTAYSIDDIYRRVGTTEYTIISRVGNALDGKELMLELISTIGSVNIIMAKDDVFDAVGCNNSEYALFRVEDMVIVPINSSINEIKLASEPIYYIFNEDDFVSKTDIFAAYIINQNPNTPEFHEAMYELSQKYSDNFSIGVMTEDLFSYILKECNVDFSNLPDFIVFNYENGFSYSNNGTMAGIEAGSENWTKLASNYLDKILSGEIEKNYLTDDEPETQDYEHLTHLVGSTFTNFIKDSEKEALVVFSQGETPEDTLEMLEEMATELEKNETNIKIGYINALKNTAPDFPVFLMQPHLQLYQNGGTSSKPFLSVPGRESYLRFLQEVSKNGEKIVAPPITYELMKEEIESLTSYLSQLDEVTSQHVINHLIYLKEHKPLKPVETNNADGGNEKIVNSEL